MVKSQKLFKIEVSKCFVEILGIKISRKKTLYDLIKDSARIVNIFQLRTSVTELDLLPQRARMNVFESVRQISTQAQVTILFKQNIFILHKKFF